VVTTSHRGRLAPLRRRFHPVGNMIALGAGGPAPGGRDNFNYRIPPTWSPENENYYSFRAYMTDASLWIMLTDL
jgi:hypothetical protein